jgi:hypothetical protein
LIYDNDSILSARVDETIEHLGIEPRRTAFRSPWQNGTAERWVGSARRELLEHVIFLNEEHLRRLLREYVEYYNADRVDTRLGDSPEGRPTEIPPSPAAIVVGLPRVGGLHHRYVWAEAAQGALAFTPRRRRDPRTGFENGKPKPQIVRHPGSRNRSDVAYNHPRARTYV